MKTLGPFGSIFCQHWVSGGDVVVVRLKVWRRATPTHPDWCCQSVLTAETRRILRFASLLQGFLHSPLFHSSALSRTLFPLPPSIYVSPNLSCSCSFYSSPTINLSSLLPSHLLSRSVEVYHPLSWSLPSFSSVFHLLLLFFCPLTLFLLEPSSSPSKTHRFWTIFV
jgi:hypothetical protein